MGFYSHIAESECTLTTGWYKPQVVERAHEEDLTKLFREVSVIEQGILTGLERLHKEAEA